VATPVSLAGPTFLASRLEPHVALVATGPLTNVAIALQRGALMKRLIWMGGGIHEGDVTPSAEFNAYVDPEAATAVLDSGIDPVVIGLDVTHRALVGRAQRERLRAAGNAGKFAAELLDFYGRSYLARFGARGVPVHDALALAAAVDPSLVHTEYVHLRIVTKGRERGRTVIVPDVSPNAHVALDVDSHRFLEFLCSGFERLP
jgi:inosine-uridine nucleoside N-ribohydrolase